MHFNYFEDIELVVSQYRNENNIGEIQALTADRLADLLERLYNYDIDKGGLDLYPELKNIRSLYIPKSKTLLLNGSMTSNQLAFQFGKELGFNYLKLKERANTSSLLKIRSFEEVLSHFKAAYFSAALLLPLNPVQSRLERFFAKKVFDKEEILGLINDYGASPEMVFQRMTNILPSKMGIRSIYFFRFMSQEGSINYKVDKELHLDGNHHPHSNKMDEIYCRRWLSIRLMEQIKKNGSKTEIEAQISQYYGTDDEYLILSHVRRDHQEGTKTVGLSLGILLDKNNRKKIGFLEDPSLGKRIVNTTCERCPMEDCKERIAPPVKYQQRQENKRIDKVLETLLK